MPLRTDTWTIDEAIAEIDDRLEELADTMADLDESSDRYQASKQAANRLEYLADGLVWQRDEAGWGADADIEIGGPTAGEKAMMHRQADDGAGDHEMRLWFVAASIRSLPGYDADDPDADMGDCFALLANCHDGFASWAEAKANSLSSPDASGNRLQGYLQERSASDASTNASTSTTSSQSPSDED